jgi:hypothetical protein
MPNRIRAKGKTLIAAALFLAVPESRAAGADATPNWSYTEYRMPQGSSFNVVSTTFQMHGVRSLLRFSFQTKAHCEATVGLAYFHLGTSYGTLVRSDPAPEEWAAQVDDRSPEQGRPISVLYTNSFEIVLPVSRALVSDAKSGLLLRMWQTAIGLSPPPPDQRTRMELSLRGLEGPLERAEANCADAMKR